MASRMTGCTFLTTFHGIYSINKMKKYYNSVMTKGKIVIAVSDFVNDHISTLYNVNKNKIKTVHRGVDLDEFNIKNVDPTRLIALKSKCYIPDGKFIITLPGRLTSWKGHEILLQAIAKLDNENICCLLAGNTKQHEQCFRKFIKLAQTLGLSDKVTFTGDIKDMPALYMLSDLVVSPSTRPEAFGRISIEAQAMQRPIIATNIGGYKETIIDGKTGFLIPPDDADALAQKIRMVMATTEEKKIAMGKVARKNVEQRFSLAQMKQSTLGIYKTLAQQI